jgi:hypothetical protein
MNNQLTYRRYEESDIPGLLRLWEKNTEWGQLTPEQWRQWYVDTPHGLCEIAVGVDQSEEARAQAVSTPTLLGFGEDELKACRISAPIVDKQLRAASKIHPVSCLYASIKETAIAGNYSLIYAFPNSSLGSFLRRYVPSLQIETVRCVAAPVSSWLGLEIGSATVAPTTQFGGEYQALWQECKRDFPLAIAVVRSPAWLQYRFGGKLALEVRGATETLLGYTIFDQNTGLLLDCLARTREDLTTVLKAALAWLARNRGELGEVKAMHTPLMAPILACLEFAAHEFQFLFGREVLNPNLSLATFDLNQWHFMPGD